MKPNKKYKIEFTKKSYLMPIYSLKTYLIMRTQTTTIHAMTINKYSDLVTLNLLDTS